MSALPKNPPSPLLFGSSSDRLVLQVAGLADSTVLKDEGIKDGDYIIVKQDGNSRFLEIIGIMRSFK